MQKKFLLLPVWIEHSSKKQAAKSKKFQPNNFKIIFQ